MSEHKNKKILTISCDLEPDPVSGVACTNIKSDFKYDITEDFCEEICEIVFAEEFTIDYI